MFNTTRQIGLTANSNAPAEFTSSTPMSIGCSHATQQPCQFCARSIEWRWLNFDDISLNDLYDLLGLRQDIFIVEQCVPYRDVDGRDRASKHLFATLDGDIIAYLRALPRDLFETGFYSFGRVVVHPKFRRLGLGRELVRRVLSHFDEAHKDTPIKISSQLYLKEFYASFGFEAKGEPYIEDRIPHIAMIRRGIEAGI